MSSKPLCSHQAFACQVNVVRILAHEGDGEAVRFSADCYVKCAECGVRFRWIGVPGGYAPSEPHVSADGFQLCAPIEPDAHMTTMMADVAPHPTPHQDTR